MTKVEDPILTAWERTRANHRDRAAILDSQGRVARTFLEIEDRAGQFAEELERVAPGQVVAVQIGNHPDWPSLFMACLRKRVVVLPLEQTISDQQRESAFQICRVAAVVVAAAVSGGSAVEILPLGTAADTISWSEKPPTLLKF